MIELAQSYRPEAICLTANLVVTYNLLDVDKRADTTVRVKQAQTKIAAQ